MKIFIRYLIIIASYVFISLILNAGYDEFDYSYIIGYIIVLLLGLPNALLTRKKEHKKDYLIWLGCSIIPGALFMIFAKFNGASGSGLMPTAWDWGLLELFVPGIFIFMQMICLAVLAVVHASRKNT